MYTLILVDYNTLETTIAYTQRIQKSIRNAGDMHIIIVENGSNERALDLLTQAYGPSSNLHIPDLERSVYQFTQDCCQIIYYHSGENLGYARGNNLGAEIAHSVWADPYYIISNNDVDFEKPFDIQIAQVLFDENPQIGVVGPHVTTPAGLSQSPHKWISAYRRLIVFIWLCALNNMISPQKYRKLRAKYCEDLCYDAVTGPCGWVSGSFFVVRSAAFHTVGMFDPHTFLYAEEPILSRRLETAGYTVWFCRELEVIHNHAQTTKTALSRLKIFELDFHSVWYYYKTYTDTPYIVLALAKCNFFLYKCFHILYNKLTSLRG